MYTVLLYKKATFTNIKLILESLSEEKDHLRNYTHKIIKIFINESAY